MPKDVHQDLGGMHERKSANSSKRFPESMHVKARSRKKLVEFKARDEAIQGLSEARKGQTPVMADLNPNVTTTNAVSVLDVSRKSLLLSQRGGH
jgi:hypothetical protein